MQVKGTMNQLNRQRDAYNTYAADYEHAVARTRTRLAPYTIQRWKTQCAGKDVLDIGCGNAYILCHLASICSYTGIDIAEVMIQQNQSRYGAGNIRFLVDNAETLARCVDASFDIVISHGCLHHVEHPEISIKHIARVLRQGGQFFAVEMNRAHPAASCVGLYAYILGLNPSRVRHWFRRLRRKPQPSSTHNPYTTHHPGHPGKRTPQEYRISLTEAGFEAIDARCLAVDLIPYQLYTKSLFLFRIMVATSQFLMHWHVFQDIGSVLLISASKPVSSSTPPP